MLPRDQWVHDDMQGRGGRQATLGEAVARSRRLATNGVAASQQPTPASTTQRSQAAKVVVQEGESAFRFHVPCSRLSSCRAALV